MSRTDPQPGDWAVAQIPGWRGESIEWMQRLAGAPARYAKWVHAFMLVEPGIVVEATPRGAVKVPIHYPPETLWWSTGVIDQTPAQRADACAAAEAFAAARIGYSFLDYAAIAAHSWHIPAPGLRDYIKSTGHLICSQLVDSAEMIAGVHLFDDRRWPGYVRPADLANLIGAP